MNLKNSSLPELHVIGAGGLARDFLVCFRDEINIAGFWDDGIKKGTLVHGIPVLGNLDELISLSSPVHFVVMVANPVIRKKFITLLHTSKHTAPVIVHSLARIFDNETATIQNGCVIFPGTMITTAAEIGEHSLIHTNCSIHHDSKIGSNCVLMPGARLTGNVEIGDDVLVGANVALTNGTKIASGEKIN